MIGEPPLGCAVIFEKAVAIEIAGTVDPGERGFDCRPQLDDNGVVSGPLRKKPGQHYEQGRSVDAAVVKAERHFAERRHLAFAHFMQDFSRLRVRCVLVRRRLKRGKPPQHTLRDARIEPKRLEGGDQSVAAERGRVPGNASVGIASLGRLRHQHAQIGHGAAHDLVKDLV